MLPPCARTKFAMVPTSRVHLMTVNDDQEKLTKEFRAWGKLKGKLSTIESRLRSQEIRSSAARKSCAAAVRGFWNTIYQIRNIEPIDLDRHPVSPYRADPVTGEPRNLKDPEDNFPEQLGIVIDNYEGSEDKVRKIIQLITEADKPGHSASRGRGSTAF